MTHLLRWASSRRALTGTGALLVVAGACWIVSAFRIDGMDAGPESDLGATGWFMVTWILMMVAMMVPVFAPTAVEMEVSRAGLALVSRVGRQPGVCRGVSGGVVCRRPPRLRGPLARSASGWGHIRVGPRRPVDIGCGAFRGGVYQLSDGKRRALERCRRRSRSVRPAAHDGVRAAPNCVGSSWALMAALLALGVMSLWWMAVVAVLIAGERLPRTSAPGRLVGAGVFLVLSLGVAVASTGVPGLTVPGSSRRDKRDGAHVTGRGDEQRRDGKIVRRRAEHEMRPRQVRTIAPQRVLRERAGGLGRGW